MKRTQLTKDQVFLLNDVIRVLQEQKEAHKGIQERKWFNLARWWDEHTCGSIGCIIGYCGHDPAFNARGLFIQNSFVNHPVYKGYRSFLALEKFFSLSEKEINYLFDASSYGPNVKIAQVIQRFRAFIKKGTPKTYVRRVVKKEVWFQTCEVEVYDPNDDAEALRNVEKGEGIDVDGDFEYSHTLEPDFWYVEEGYTEGPLDELR